MKTEELKELGLDEETIKKVFALNGKDVESIKKQLEAKEKELETSNSEKSTMQKNVDELKEQLKAFDGVDVQGLNSKIKELQTKMDEQAKAFEGEKLERAFQEKLDSFITKKNGRNTTAIKSLLKVDDLRKSNNQDSDIENALDELAKAEDSNFLFGSDEPLKKGVGATGGASGSKDDEDEALINKIMGIPMNK